MHFTGPSLVPATSTRRFDASPRRPRVGVRRIDRLQEAGAGTEQGAAPPELPPASGPQPWPAQQGIRRTPPHGDRAAPAGPRRTECACYLTSGSSRPTATLQRRRFAHPETEDATMLMLLIVVLLLLVLLGGFGYRRWY